jgi:hypothetical protein
MGISFKLIMRKITFIFLFLMFVNSVLLAQPIAPDTLWMRTYGGDEWDYARGVEQTQDGGFAFIGDTKSFGLSNRDLWLVKVDPAGDRYLLTGCTNYGVEGSDVLIIRTDSLGNSLWSRQYGDYWLDENINSIDHANSGGYILAGTLSSLVSQELAWLVRINENGDTLWTRTYGGDSHDYCNSVRLTSDGGYILAGGTQTKATHYGPEFTQPMISAFFIVFNRPLMADISPSVILAG